MRNCGWMSGVLPVRCSRIGGLPRRGVSLWNMGVTCRIAGCSLPSGASGGWGSGGRSPCDFRGAAILFRPDVSGRSQRPVRRIRRLAAGAAAPSTVEAPHRPFADAVRGCCRCRSVLRRLRCGAFTGTQNLRKRTIFFIFAVDSSGDNTFSPKDIIFGSKEPSRP